MAAPASSAPSEPHNATICVQSRSCWIKSAPSMPSAVGLTVTPEGLVVVDPSWIRLAITPSTATSFMTRRLDAPLGPRAR